MLGYLSDLYIDTLTADNIKDKAVSAGEKSSLKLKSKITNSDIGIAAKDLSSVEIEMISLADVKVPVALFVKKPEFGPPELMIANEFPDALQIHSLVSEDSNFIANEQIINGIYSSEEVHRKLYGNEFGVKTTR